MKKNILFLALGGKDWIGEVYYVKNQVVQLLEYPLSAQKLQMIIYVNRECAQEFTELAEYKNITLVYRDDVQKTRFVNSLFVLLDDVDIELLYLVMKYHISYIFPYFPKGKRNYKLFIKKSISWIPDFQHLRLPQFFSKGEIDRRNKEFTEIAAKHYKLVLSSQAAYNDYLEKYPEYDKDVYVVSFVSALKKSDVLCDAADAVKEKYNITDRYFIICNQFWMHKNHMFVFKALKALVKDFPTVSIVCTGNTKDYRNRNYVEEVKEFIAENSLKNNIKILGLIPKWDQIQLIKGAVAMIQPSLFEGWGTCLEDAKTIGQRVLLSDIPVHREQMNSKCQLFNVEDTKQLEELMRYNLEEVKSCESQYNLERAAKYGETFFHMMWGKR